MDNHVTLMDSNFTREVLQSEQPVLVDFWAPWCMPCLMVAPVIEEIAKEYDGKIKIGKLNTDDNPRMAMQYQIMGIPSLVLYKNGEVMDRIVGVVPKEHITRILDKHIQTN